MRWWVRVVAAAYKEWDNVQIVYVPTLDSVTVTSPPVSLLNLVWYGEMKRTYPRWQQGGVKLYLEQQKREQKNSLFRKQER